MATVGIAAALFGLTAVPASAYVGDVRTISVGSQPTYLRPVPSRSSTPILLAPAGSAVLIDCQSWGETVSGIAGRPGSSALWDRVLSQGRWGWMSDLMVDGTPYQVRDTTVPECPGGQRRWGATQASNTGVAGNCTWGVMDKVHALTGLYPQIGGDARQWYSTAIANRYVVVRDAQPRSIVVFQPGVQGAGYFGHVAWVESVESRADGLYVHILEMNFANFNQWDRRTVKDVAGMGYILIP